MHLFTCFKIETLLNNTIDRFHHDCFQQISCSRNIIRRFISFVVIWDMTCNYYFRSETTYVQIVHSSPHIRELALLKSMRKKKPSARNIAKELLYECKIKVTLCL